jgi:hypothetical protein
MKTRLYFAKEKAMRQNKRFIQKMTLLSFLLYVFGAATFVYGSENDNANAGAVRIQVMSGEVSSVDWVARKITIDLGDGNLMTISVPEDVAVTHNGKDSTFSNVEVSDSVRIGYYKDQTSGALVAKTIDDMDVGND